MVLKALPCVGLEVLGSGDALRGEIWKRRIIRLAVVHEDLALASNAEMLLRTLGGIGHGDERHVGVSESLGVPPKIHVSVP